MTFQQDLQRYRENWQTEIESAFLYRTLARLETQPTLAAVYHRLADTELAHAQLWAERLQQSGYALPRRRIGWRPRSLALLARWFGPQFILPTLSLTEQVGGQGYDTQTDARVEVPGRSQSGAPVDGSPRSISLAGQERSHARLLQAIASVAPTGMAGNTVAQLEGRHRAAGGNTLRAAVLGANDGLLSNLSLVMGIAGAQMASQAILVTGVAGLLAGACSMALGEWLSVQSARELYERQIRIERREIETAPEEEEEELALIYEAKGLPPEQARNLAAHMMQDPATAVDTLTREELGIDPQELGGSPWTAALTSFLLFTLGAVVPVLPFTLLQGPTAIIVSLVLSGVALFLIGAGITLLTGRSVWFSGSRQVLFGLAAAAITYGVGHLLGVTLTG